MLQRFGLFADYWDHTGSPEPHDGSIESLADAVRIMAYLQLNQQLETSEVEAIVVFLESLTGDIPSNFSPPPDIPFELPEGVSP